ncbi:MAG: IPT/TIG domain-containing protein [Verrucomicrobiota bacterium]
MGKTRKGGLCALFLISLLVASCGASPSGGSKGTTRSSHGGAPNISLAGIDPSTGPTNGGAVVTVSGSGFESGGGLYEVLFGGSDFGGECDVKSSTRAVCTSPAHDPGTVNLVIETYDSWGAYGEQDTINSDVRFTFVGPATTTTTDPPTTTAPPTTAVPTTTTIPTTTSPSTTTGGCSPLSSSGNCYRAGQRCPASDDGATGRDANGSPIYCRTGSSGYLYWQH